MNAVITTNSRSIWNFLKSQGLSDFGVAGLMGNLYAESNLTSINLENTGNAKLGMSDQEYTNAVDSGTYINFIYDGYGYGIAQWTWHSRKADLYDYVKSMNLSIGDLNGQLKFLISELKEYREYANVYNTLKTATSVEEASNVVLLEFEKPADTGDKVKELRALYGRQFYEQYASNNNTIANINTNNKFNNSTNTGNNYIEYNVKAGDTLWSIAGLNGISVDDILSANTQLSLNSVIYPGQIVIIPIKKKEEVKTESSDNNTTIGKDKYKHPILEKFAKKFGKIFKFKKN